MDETSDNKTFTFDFYFQMNYGLLLYFKLTRVVMGNISKKGEKYGRYY